MNRIAFGFFLLHVPAILVIAAVNGVGLGTTALLLGGALALPALAYLTFDSPRSISVVFGVTAMLIAGVLIHAGQGPVQIEMHFHIFVLIALLAVFANPLVIVAAAATVAGHHAVVWLLAPTSVFNYSAALWVVGIHAAFVVIEAVAACFIARSFFDNVIGLEKIIVERTAELARKNEQKRRVLDHVEQGFLEIDCGGKIAPESSAALSRWFGDLADGTTFGALLRRADAAVADCFESGLEQINDDFLPLAVTIDQLPSKLQWHERSFTMAYTPLTGATAQLEGFIVVVSDVTEQRARERLEAEQIEMARIFQSISKDKTRFLEFWDEADGYMQAITAQAGEDLTLLKRNLHTLKGNAAFFGLRSLSDKVHEVEQHVVEEGQLGPAAREELVLAWQRVHRSLDTFLSDRRAQRRVEIDISEFEAAVASLRKKDPHLQIARRLETWRLEPVRRRFDGIADQVRLIGTKLGRGPIDVVIDDGGVLFVPDRWAKLWSSFVHLARNAVDHGIEPPDEREQKGKPVAARIALTAKSDDDHIVLTVADDGRGVDWKLLIEKARVRELPVGTEADRQAALFSDGVSTRDTATELSGRGVGMGAVKAAVVAMGGTVHVTSTIGQGTEVIVRIPVDAVTRPLRAAEELSS